MSKQTSRGDDSPLIRDTLDSPGERFADTTVIDVDVHVTYTDDLKRKAAAKMAQPWADYVDPDVSSRGDLGAHPSPGVPLTLGGRKDRFVADAGDPETVHRDLCEGLGIDYPIINTITGADRAWTEERAVEEVRAVNDVLIEEFLDPYEEFLGAGSISLRDPAAAAEEVDRLGKEDRMVGAFMFSGTRYQKPPGDPEYDIVYQAMEDNDITPFFHVASATDVAPWVKKFDTAFAWHSLYAWSIQQAVVSLIAQGTPEKFPDLDFFMIEGGIGWLPFLMGRLNREYAQWLPEVSILEKKPEEYIRDQFYFSTQPIFELDDPAHARRILEIIGADSLLFATDYPHYDFDNPSTIATLIEDFPEEDREKILYRNAAEALGLDL